jgi:outer membrane protein assembly factor BamB
MEYVAGGIIYSTPAIGADGTVFFGSNDAKLYA